VLILSESDQLPAIRQAYELGASAYSQNPVSAQEWKKFLAELKRHWFETVTLPG